MFEDKQYTLYKMQQILSVVWLVLRIFVNFYWLLNLKIIWDCDLLKKLACQWLMSCH